MRKLLPSLLIIGFFNAGLIVLAQTASGTGNKTMSVTTLCGVECDEENCKVELYDNSASTYVNSSGEISIPEGIQKITSSTGSKLYFPWTTVKNNGEIQIDCSDPRQNQDQQDQQDQLGEEVMETA